MDKQGKEIKMATYEQSIFCSSHGELFSNKGDAGAIIFDRMYRPLGMIFAGNDATAATYFTLLEDLVRDIKKMTEAIEVRFSIKGLEDWKLAI